MKPIALVAFVFLAIAPDSGLAADSYGMDGYIEAMKAGVLTNKDGVITMASQYEAYISPVRAPMAAAVEYLTRYADVLAINPGLFRTNLEASAKLLPGVGEEYRHYKKEMALSNDADIFFDETFFGLPLYDGGISVDIERRDDGSLVVHGATLNRHTDLKVEQPSDKALQRAQHLDGQALVASLGLSGKEPYKPESLKIGWSRLIIYRYEADKRKNNAWPVPLPPVAKRLEDGKHYVAAEVSFGVSMRYPTPLWRAIVDVETLSVLYLQGEYYEGVSGGRRNAL